MNYSQTRERLYSEVRTVDMSANKGDASPRPPVLRDCESEQGTLVPERRRDIVKPSYRARQQSNLPREVIFATILEISLPVIFLSNLQRLRRQVEGAMSEGILSQSRLSLSGWRHYVLRERESERRSRIVQSERQPRELRANRG